MTHEEETKSEILGLARMMSEAETPPTHGNAMAPASLGYAAASASLDAAREMFLDVFVSAALDHVSGTLDHEKDAIASSAAEYASNGVDALKAGIARVKVMLGLPPTPSR